MEIEEEEYSVIWKIPAHGGSTIGIECPFCGKETTAYLWSLAGSGKKCEGNCIDTIFYRTCAQKRK